MFLISVKLNYNLTSNQKIIYFNFILTKNILKDLQNLKTFKKITRKDF